jgi:hypothetical protein
MYANDEMMLNGSTTPNLVDFRTAIEINIQRRHDLRQIAPLTNTFAGFVGMNLSFLQFSMAASSEPDGLFVRLLKPGASKKPVGAPPSATFRIAKQYKQVTARDLLMWEKEGGKAQRAPDEDQSAGTNRRGETARGSAISNERRTREFPCLAGAEKDRGGFEVGRSGHDE